ncbi:hypothetical protein [Pseudoduganella violaceinigra]|uniref:hypothetical protein n=1 Tax=Pseudoduganella violaceinigra TaxID=246602 RepID=UPI000484FE5C|nr:hypothetical protein [Pseudoduganella violaceinigra]
MALRLREGEPGARQEAGVLERLLGVLQRHCRKGSEDQVLWLLAVAVTGMADQLQREIPDRTGVNADMLRRWSASLCKFALSMVRDAETV